MIRHSFIVVITGLVFTLSCKPKSTIAVSAAAQQETPAVKKPVNIILMIGDGMGLAQVSATIVANGSLPGFELFKMLGFSKTSSSDDYITDSAAGATALSTGEKTYNGAVGVGPDTLARQTILELAEANGLATGLVVTCSVTHATPASFFAHRADREMHEQIASDFYGKGIDFVAGAGKKYFDVSRLNQDGYTVLTGYKSLQKPVKQKEKTFWFYSDSIAAPQANKGRGDFLPDATSAAINTLKGNAKGFFLMVEGSQIDWGGHNNDLPYTVAETVDFDKAIQRAMAFAKADGNTLVIVTADHETGGLALIGGSLQGKTVVPHYANDHHSGIMVPIYAFGPGAEQFTGIMENTDIFKKMRSLYGF